MSTELEVSLAAPTDRSEIVTNRRGADRACYGDPARSAITKTKGLPLTR